MTLKCITTSLVVEPNTKHKHQHAPAAAPVPSSVCKSSNETRSTPAAAPMPLNTRLSTGSRQNPSPAEVRDVPGIHSDSEEIEMIEPAFNPNLETEDLRKMIALKPQENPLNNAESALISQRKDIDHILETLFNVQRDVDFIKSSISNVESGQPGNFGHSQNFTEEIDILTENVSKFGKGVSEIEGLRFDVKMMQQRVKRLEEERARNRISIAAAEHPHPQDVIRHSTPVPGVKESPQPTPRDHTGFLRETLLTSRNPYFKNASQGSSEMPVGEHPPRNEYQFPDDFEHMNGGFDPYGDAQPSGRKSHVETARGNTSAGRYLIPPIITPDRPSSRVPYTPIDPRLSDAPQNAMNENSESFGRATVTAEAMQATNNSRSATGNMSDDERVVDVPHQLRYPSPLEHQMTARQAQMVSSTDTEAYRHISVSPSVSAPGLGRFAEQGRSGTGTEIDADANGFKRRKTAASVETAYNALSSPARVFTSQEANSRPSLSAIRNEEGLLVRADGKIDGRSIRYALNKSTRTHRLIPGPRDVEGYLLRSDGTRDARSVRSLDAARRKKAGAQTLTGAQAVAGQMMGGAHASPI